MVEEETEEGTEVEEEVPEKDTFGYYMKALLIVALFYLVLTPILATPWADTMPADYEEEGLQSIDLAEAVFEHYGVPFFILGFVLVASVVGGIYLAKDELRTRRWGR
jgi:NADH:ubiquinone oxidoreductase subunit 6 (subunit J)